MSVGSHVIVGSGSVILAGVTIGDSSAVGALSLVKQDVEPFSIVAGIPARLIRERDRGHLALAERLLEGRSGRVE